MSRPADAPRSSKGVVGQKRRREGNEEEKEAEDDTAPAATRRPVKDVEELNVDEFLQSGLLAGGDDEEGGEGEDDFDGGEDEDDEDDPLVLETDGSGNSRLPPDSDDEDEGADGEGEEGRLMAEIAQHEADMKALAKSDPAFYQHLKDNDAELLRFNRDDVMGDEDEEEEERKEGEGRPKKARKAKAKQPAGQSPPLPLSGVVGGVGGFM